MKLDKRITLISDIYSVNDGCHDWKFMNKYGYFADKINDFEDLSRCAYGTYTDYREQDKCFSCRTCSKGVVEYDWFTYFIPEEDLKPEEPEKKYRAYTTMEFIKDYPLGSHLHFRPKNDTIEMHRLIDGYNDCLNGAGTLFLSGVMFSMQELYNNYEIFRDGEWLPFGVEGKE